jgi:trk system potassium uptake protein TrkH
VRLRSTSSAYRILISLVGKSLIGLGLLLALPFTASLLAGEWPAAVDFLIGIGATLAAGFALSGAGAGDDRPSRGIVMISLAFSWPTAMIFSAIPFWLSGHCASFLDAAFDAMCCLTTTGFSFLGDIDHVSIGLTTWRHVLAFAGGQAAVVMALVFSAEWPAGVGEPPIWSDMEGLFSRSIARTATNVLCAGLPYFAIGTVSLSVVGIATGLPLGQAVLHGLWIFMSAWSTTGIAPMSQNLIFYHSGLYETLAIVFSMLGAFNVALRFASGRKRVEIGWNLETATLVVSLTALALIVCASLAEAGTYADGLSLFRSGFSTLASAHASTGFATVYPQRLAADWGSASVLALIFAMLVGGSSLSAAGGFKGLRIGLVAKAILGDVRRVSSSPSAVSEQRFRYIGERVVDDAVLRNALTIIVLYVGAFAVASLLGTVAGFPLGEAAFEAASAVGNVGLSIGLATSAMPGFLKITYVVVMWLGRLEFTAAIMAAGFVVAVIGGRR